jgi:hypothetical protein
MVHEEKEMLKDQYKFILTKGGSKGNNLLSC